MVPIWFKVAFCFQHFILIPKHFQYWVYPLPTCSSYHRVFHSSYVIFIWWRQMEYLFCICYLFLVSNASHIFWLIFVYVLLRMTLHWWSIFCVPSLLWCLHRLFQCFVLPLAFGFVSFVCYRYNWIDGFKCKWLSEIIWDHSCHSS